MHDTSRTTGTAIWLGIVLFIGHELDAVARHEWRLLPGLSSLENGADVFVLLHVPLFAVVFWVMTHGASCVKSLGRAVIAALLIIHGGVHFTLTGHELYEFQGIVALITIYGGALAAGAYLALQAIDSR